MRLGKLGEQICIKSSKAFDRLMYVDSTIADGAEYYIKRTKRDRKARDDYFKLLEQAASDKESIYIIDILRQQWRNDDERIR